MRPVHSPFLLAAVAACALMAAPAAAQTPAAASVPVAQLISQVSIPHSTFKLKNGLTVIIHEDHKAPVVAVSTWYNVGSKDEPRGKTGFAHLFEHLMFNGSENLPGDYFTYLTQVGATDYNGTTNNDRTNYFETVPKGALERTLFMESDRMGHLLGAVTQGVLDNQRGVVENEKRQGDSRPGGLIQYSLMEGIFPTGHPYHHTVIGSMADLDAASLADVKQWFRDKYGPNNAVLVIAGDTNAAEARPLVEKYFGPIARGPVNHPAMARVPHLGAAKLINLKDVVATTIITRNWAVPGLLAPQLAALDIGGSVLGGLASSRLDKALVRDEQVAVAVSAGIDPMQRAGIFTVQAYAKPGTDPALVAKRMDSVMAELIAKGPTDDEVQRAVMHEVAGRIRGLEQVGSFGGKAVSLAEGQTFAGDSDFYKKTMAEYAAVTPAKVRAAMRQWLTGPALTITLSPGQREAYNDAKAAAAAPKKAEEALAKPTRAIPPVGQLQALQWPAITHARLSNGVELVYAQRGAVPLTQLSLAFDAGSASDPLSKRGLAAMTMGLLDEGAAGMSSQQIAEAEERLGANINAGNDADRSVITLSALSPNLAPSLDLLADLALRPTFAPADIDRVRVQTLTGIEQMRKDPQRVGQRVLPAAIYGPSHPYGAPAGGDPAAIKALSRSDLVGWQQAWLRPENLKIFVVSNLPLADLQPQLEQRFGSWTPPGVAKGVKTFPAPPARATAPRILLVDRPGAPQSTVLAGQIIPLDPRSDTSPFYIANEALGGNFLSRLNMDLRETRGWSYGVSGSQSILPNGSSYIIAAPVQADRTGEALAALNGDVTDYLTTKGATADEVNRYVFNAINELPGQFETSGALLSGMMRNDLLGRPDDFYVQLAPRYRSLTPAKTDSAIRSAIDPKGFVWVVVGDAAKLRPQLDKLGMPIEVVEAP
ncbi:MAG: pitrilysin family protein [Pseudomonadota bacterium]|nr:pitrilysin family protein [Pseudomonadota bacterium]